ncbi:MAG: hypothetical protein RIQ63_199 [Actinomycetota bacterium]
MIRIGRRRRSITAIIAAITTIVCLFAPGSASAALIPDVPVTPIRTPQASFMSFTGLLPAPTDGTFFTPPTPLPGRPGDVIWAQLSSTPATDILGTFSGATTATPAPAVKCLSTELARLQSPSTPTGAAYGLEVAPHPRVPIGPQAGLLPKATLLALVPPRPPPVQAYYFNMQILILAPGI